MNELTNYLRTSFNKSVLFDTGIVIDYLAGDKRAKAFFEEYVFSGKLTPVLSSQSVGEIFTGARNKREEADIDKWFSSLFDIALVDYAVSKQAGLLKRSAGIRLADCVIAATAINRKIPLVTTLPESYRRVNLRIFKPYL